MRIDFTVTKIGSFNELSRNEYVVSTAPIDKCGTVHLEPIYHCFRLSIGRFKLVLPFRINSQKESLRFWLAQNNELRMVYERNRNEILLIV